VWPLICIDSYILNIYISLIEDLFTPGCCKMYSLVYKIVGSFPYHSFLKSPLRSSDTCSWLYIKYRLLHEYGYLRYFRDLRNGLSRVKPEVIIVPFRRSLKSIDTCIRAITCLDYGSRWLCLYGSPSLMAIS